MKQHDKGGREEEGKGGLCVCVLVCPTASALLARFPVFEWRGPRLLSLGNFYGGEERERGERGPDKLSAEERRLYWVAGVMARL